MIKENKEIKMQSQRKEEPIYTFTVDDANTITISCGNTKIGKMLNWSTLPGNEEHPLIAKGRIVTNVTGTCTHNCNGCFKSCYARRSILQHHNSVTKPWAENTLMIRYKFEECFRLIDQTIREKNKKYYTTGNISDLQYKFFRVNVSGELQTLEELEAWNDLALKHPAIKFGIYTKNSLVLLAFFKKHGQSADNFCINVSEWHGTMKETIKALHAMGAIFNVFEYDDSNLSACTLSEEERKALSSSAHCPAVGPTQANRHPVNPVTGQTWRCVDCKACYTKTGTKRCVYSH
jgi:hypothetical protein